MKQSILGFNQEASVKLGLTIKDLLLLQYITCAVASETMNHVTENGQDYVWLQRKKIMEDLPILDIKERELNYSINKLKTLGLIDTKDVRESGVRGSRIYYGVTEKCNDLKYEETPAKAINTGISTLGAKNCNQSENDKDMTAKNCNQNDVLPAKNCNQNTQLGAKNCTSDNKLISNNFTNVKLGQSSITPLNNSQPKRRVLVPTENPVSTPVKRKNKYENCRDIIYEIFTDVELIEILLIYLPVRLAIKNKPIFANGWRSLLEKLRDMTQDNKTRVKIVQQSIDNGWATFVELKRYNYNNRQKFAEGKNGLKLGRDANEEIINETF